MTAPDAAADSDESRESQASGSRGVSAFTLVGIVLILLGLAVLGYVAWEYFGTNVVAERQAESNVQKLESAWKDPLAASSSGEPVSPAQLPPGNAMALIRIPALGSDWVWPVVVGTDLDDLDGTVGWYSDTAAPGEVGNFAVAGHRVTHGEPFRRLLELGVKDQVIIETRTATYTYQLDNDPAKLTVPDTAGWVLDPVPGKDGQKPSKALITLTTCQDLFRSADRSVAFGHLVKTTPRT